VTARSVWVLLLRAGMKRASILCSLAALALLFTPLDARASGSGGDPVGGLGAILVLGILVLAIDGTAVVGGTVSAIGTAGSLSEQPPSEGWRDASIGFGVASLIGGAFWLWGASASDWHPVPSAIGGIHMGVAIADIALAIASRSAADSMLVPIAGIDKYNKPFFGAGVLVTAF